MPKVKKHKWKGKVTKNAQSSSYGKRQNSESPKYSKLVFYILRALFSIAAVAVKFIKNFQVYFINYV